VGFSSKLALGATKVYLLTYESRCLMTEEHLICKITNPAISRSFCAEQILFNFFLIHSATDQLGSVSYFRYDVNFFTVKTIRKLLMCA